VTVRFSDHYRKTAANSAAGDDKRRNERRERDDCNNCVIDETSWH
jgi:hypothetical protein